MSCKTTLNENYTSLLMCCGNNMSYFMIESEFVTASHLLHDTFINNFISFMLYFNVYLPIFLLPLSPKVKNYIYFKFTLLQHPQKDLI